MQIILASAKIMNDRLKSVPDISLSTPLFQQEAAHRINKPEALQAFSYEGFQYEPTLGEADFPHFIRP